MNPLLDKSDILPPRLRCAARMARGRPDAGTPHNPKWTGPIRTGSGPDGRDRASRSRAVFRRPVAVRMGKLRAPAGSRPEAGFGRHFLRERPNREIPQSRTPARVDPEGDRGEIEGTWPLI